MSTQDLSSRPEEDRVFDTPEFNKCIKTVEQHLKSLPLEYHEKGGFPGFEIQFPAGGPPILMVVAAPEDEEGTTAFVALSARIVEGVRVSTALCRYLLETNLDAVLFHYALDDDAILLHHMIHAEQITRTEVYDSVRIIASAAFHQTPELVERFGGEQTF